MRLRIGWIVLLGVALAAGCAAPTAPGSAGPPVLVGEFRGDGAQMGAQHGRLFRQTIAELYEKYLLSQLRGQVRIQARSEALKFEALMRPEHRSELDALAAAVGVDHDDVALVQCFLDLAPAMGCSTIALPAAASSDGVARFGRNLDFPSQGVLDKNSALLIFHPAGRYQFAMIGWPGMIGAVSGINEHGLCLANMEVDRTAEPPTGMPYTLLYRTILEQCRTVDEAVALLNRTPHQTANNLMLMDAAGNRAVAEIRPDGLTVRRGRPGAALISTNHQRGQDADSRGRCWRYDTLHVRSARAFGKLDVAAVEQLLGAVTQGFIGDMTLQSMVFEPANRVVYLATGRDAPSRAYQRIDLKPYFNEGN